MSPPMLPSVKLSAIHGSNRVITRGSHLGMRREVVVQPVRPGVHQLAQPRRAARVERLQLLGIDEQPLAQVLPDRALALGLCEAAEADQIVALDAVEVVLGLGVDHPEDGVGIGLAHHVRNAPVVPRDRHVRGLREPACVLRRVWRGSGGRAAGHERRHDGEDGCRTEQRTSAESRAGLLVVDRTSLPACVDVTHGDIPPHRYLN